MLLLIVALFAFTSCNKLKPNNDDRSADEIEFSFLKDNECFSKYNLYLISGETVSFCMPVFTNKFIEETAVDFPIKFVSANGKNIGDVNFLVVLDWVSCDSKFNSIYVFKFTLSQKEGFDLSEKERKITSLRFSYENNVSDFAVDVNINATPSAPYELINNLSIIRNNTKYVTKTETDNDNINSFPYPMTFYWDCAAWGSEDITDFSKFATIKSGYFENGAFSLCDLNLYYHPIDSPIFIDYAIANPLDFEYTLSQRIDTLDFNLEKTVDCANFLFIGDNLIFEIEYNGNSHKVVVANIQLHCRNIALEQLFGQ
jgi:hypothetical protein